MTPLFALIRKDLLLFLSDRRALLISLALPIVIGAFFGYLTGGSGKKGGVIDVALVQQDDSAASRKIEAGLKADPGVRMVVMSIEQAQAAVRKGDQKVALVIPAGFGKAASAALFGGAAKPEVRLLYDPSQPAVLAMAKGMLTQQVMQVVSADMFSGGEDARAATEATLIALEKNGGRDAQTDSLRELMGSVQKYQVVQAQDATAAAGAGMAMPFTMRDEQLSSSKGPDGYNGYAHSFAGMGVQFILFMGIDMGISLLLARRGGVWNRLLAAPVSLTTVLLARAASVAVIGFVLMCVIFAVGVAVFGVRIASYAGFIGVAASFALLTAGFGLLVAAFGKTPEAARGIALFATMVMVMLGGAWMPSFLFPEWVQRVTLAIPTRWAVDALDAVTWRGLGLEAAAPAMAVQLGFALVFGALAIWKFRRQQA